MRLILSLSLICILFSCSDTEKARIDSVEDCFNVKIPDCRTLVRNDYESFGTDYSFELEFHFDSECYQKFLKELANAEKYLQSDEKEYETYEWTSEDKSESASLMVFHTKQDVIFIFDHL